MADKVIGLDIGTNAVRAVAVTLGDRPRINLLGQVSLPPGAVHEGEVVDVAAVAAQLRVLWKQVGFKGKAVRVGIASARVILRVVEMPVLSEGDTRSALRLQLGDYIPLAPEATAFDYQPLDPMDGAGEGGRRLLLAAAPRDAVEPLIAAVRLAGLKVVAVDVIAAALARAVPSGPSSSRHDPAVEAIVSIGAGTIVVVVARGGEPLFARTVTNVSGRHVTDRIAAVLSVPSEEAEQLKRNVLPGTPDDLAARVLLATDPSTAEICNEIGDSLDYYAAQPGNPPIDAVQVTGGGALLVGLSERLERRLRVPVRMADPFARFEPGLPGFEDEDLPYLAPFMSAAVGVALGAAATKAKQINLAPDTAPLMFRSRRPLAVGGLLVVTVLGGAYMVVQQSEALAEARTTQAQIEQALVPARELAAVRAQAAEPAGTALGARSALLRFARTVDVDWSIVASELDATGDPLGVTITSLIGTAAAPAAPAAPATAASPATPEAATAATPPTSDPAAAATPVPATGSTPQPAPGVGGLGTMTVNGSAADLDVVAAWIDAVVANPHFSAAWVGATTKVVTPSGATEIQFTGTVSVTAANTVPRNLPEVGPS